MNINKTYAPLIPDQFTASDMNQVKDELENAILGSQTLNANDVNQLGKHIANASMTNDYFIDSGIADAYVLSITGNFESPTQLFEGMKIRFKALHSNTGASTINVAGLGVKNIKRDDGLTTLSIGDITNTDYTQLIYDGTNFILINNSYIKANKVFSNTINTPYLSTNNIIPVDNNIDFNIKAPINAKFNFEIGDAYPLKLTYYSSITNNGNSPYVNIYKMGLKTIISCYKNDSTGILTIPIFSFTGDIKIFGAGGGNTNHKIMGGKLANCAYGHTYTQPYVDSYGYSGQFDIALSMPSVNIVLLTVSMYTINGVRVTLNNDAPNDDYFGQITLI